MPWSSGLEDRLARVVSPLVTRCVPVRGVERGPLGGVARVRWADGTVLLARSSDPAALTSVMRALVARQHVVATQVRASPPEGVVVTLAREGRRGPVEILVTGLDQPD